MIFPAMSALIFTWVFGSILPGARTRAVTSSRRTLASWTASTLPRAPRTTLNPTTRTTTTAPSVIQIHLFFMNAASPLASLAHAAHALDRGLGDSDVGQSGHEVALR